MWTFVTQLLVTLVLLGFFLVSCQNVMHIVKGSLCFVLKHIHQELDKELGESEGVSDDEETISTRVVRRRVFLKVTARQEAGLRAWHRGVRGQQPGEGTGPRVSSRALPLGTRAGCGARWDCHTVVAWAAHLWDLGEPVPGPLLSPAVTLRAPVSVEGFPCYEGLSKIHFGASLPVSGPPL